MICPHCNTEVSRMSYHLSFCKAVARCPGCRLLVENDGDICQWCTGPKTWKQWHNVNEHQPIITGETK
jgi:hypothetical protein